MKIIVVEPNKKVLFIRGLKDEDGDFKVQVADNYKFIDATDLVYFSETLGKLSLFKFSGIEDLDDLVNVDETGEIESL